MKGAQAVRRNGHTALKWLMLTSVMIIVPLGLCRAIPAATNTTGLYLQPSLFKYQRVFIIQIAVLTLGQLASEVPVHFKSHRSGVFNLLVFLTLPSTLPHISYTRLHLERGLKHGGCGGQSFSESIPLSFWEGAGQDSLGFPEVGKPVQVVWAGSQIIQIKNLPCSSVHRLCKKSLAQFPGLHFCLSFKHTQE